MYDIDDLKNLVDMAAGGRSPADLLITNAKLVDVLTGEIRETDVSVGGGKILGFSHTEAVKVVTREEPTCCPASSTPTSISNPAW